VSRRESIYRPVWLSLYGPRLGGSLSELFEIFDVISSTASDGTLTSYDDSGGSGGSGGGGNDSTTSTGEDDSVCGNSKGAHTGPGGGGIGKYKEDRALWWLRLRQVWGTEPFVIGVDR